MPNLSLPALRKHVADARLAPVYLFLGDDLTLVDRMVDAVESVVDVRDRAFAVERLYAGEAGAAPVDIASAARIMPMLGDRRIVTVLRAERLLKPKRAPKGSKDAGALDDEDARDDAGEDAGQPADTAALEDYLATPVPSSTLIFVAADVDKTRRLTKRVLEAAQVVEFRGLAGAGDRTGDTLAWLKDELTKAGREIDADAARLLVARSAGDINKLRGDVERLLLYAEGRRRLRADDVMEVAAEHQAVDDEWGVVNAIANGDAAKALVEVGLRLDRGDSAHALLGQLRWWVSNRLVQSQSGRTKPAIEALLRTDLALKSSGGDDRVLLERLVVELTGAPIAPQRTGWSGRR